MAEVHGSEEGRNEGLTSGDDLVAGTLAYLARSLVEHPDDVRVSVVPEEGRTRVRLDVHPDDLGRVIGRGGRVARAIRAITKAAAARAGEYVFVEIGDPRPRPQQ